MGMMRYLAEEDGFLKKKFSLCMKKGAMSE
jgi:hypothetical protein